MAGAPLKIQAGILTVSDRCSGEREDESGPTLESLLRNSDKISPHLTEITRSLCSDDKSKIQRILEDFVSRKLDLVLTTGGTGLSPRDVTPEATMEVVERECPGLVAAMYRISLEKTPLGALSRFRAGTASQTLIINMPGSVKAVKECFSAVEPAIIHAIQHMREDRTATDAQHDAMQTTHNHTDINSELCPSRRPRQSPYPMVGTDEAVKMVLEGSPALERALGKRPTMECLGCVLGETVLAPGAHPPFPASIKDGYAVLASDGAGLRNVVGAVIAGDTDPPIVGPGVCVRISTGAPLPPGADAVVQVEDTRLVSALEDGEENEIQITVPPKLGQDIRALGSDVQEGEVLLCEGAVLGVPELGLLASMGVSKISVFASPKVAVLSTGNELVEADAEKLAAGQIRDSNRPALLGLFQMAGFQTLDMGIAPDTMGELRGRVEKALDSADVLVTTGGVSMGEKDLLKKLLEDLGFRIHFGRVAMKPGKPTTFATGLFNNKTCVVFGLPGNPVSAFVTAHLFVVPALRKLKRLPRLLPHVISAKTCDRLKLDPEREEFHRGILETGSGEMARVRSTGANQMSSRLLSAVAADVLIRLPPATPQKKFLEEGDTVVVYLI